MKKNRISIMFLCVFSSINLFSCDSCAAVFDNRIFEIEQSLEALKIYCTDQNTYSYMYPHVEGVLSGLYEAQAIARQFKHD